MPDLRETKSFFQCPAEVKADADKRIIKGYASVFGNVDSHGDIIQQGAFVESIDEWFNKPKKSRIKVLWEHWKLIGVPTELFEDSKGVYFEGHISKTQQGDEALELIADGACTEMSIGLTTLMSTAIEQEEREKHDGARRIITKARLWEVSPVVWGANDATNVDRAKSLQHQQLKDLAERIEALENQLRENEQTKNQLELIESYRSGLRL